MDEFETLTSKPLLDDCDDYDWSDNGGGEIAAIESESVDIESNDDPFDATLHKDLPPGITTPDHYHE